MAALSVHRARLGRKAPIPSSAQTSSIRRRSRELAATPPARHRAVAPTSAAAAPGPGDQHVDHRLARKEAATSAVAASGCLRTVLTTDVLRPLNEKSYPSPGSDRGKAKAVGSPWSAIRSMAGPPGIAQPEEPGHLVEGLAGGVVDGAAEQPVAAGLGHLDQQGVAAGHQQHHQRPAQVGLLQQRGEEVGLEVVDADQGNVPGQGQGLGLGHAHQQRADQARARR